MPTKSTTKQKMSINSTISNLKSDLIKNIKSTQYVSSRDFRIEDNNEDTISVSIRDLGMWENPEDAEDEEDYDWQELCSLSREQINKVISNLQKTSNRKIEWYTSEKNWITFDIEGGN